MANHKKKDVGHVALQRPLSGESREASSAINAKIAAFYLLEAIVALSRKMSWHGFENGF